MTEEQLAAVLAGCETTQERLLVQLCAQMGIRASEAWAIWLDHLDK